jgi:hypothetical protein
LSSLVLLGRRELSQHCELGDRLGAGLF